MNILIKDALIIPMTSEEEVVTGSLAIEGSVISAIEKEIDPAGFAKVIDASNCIVMPSLVNAHTHLSMLYFRNYGDQFHDLQSWLEAIWVLEEKLTAEDIYPASLLAMAEMIQSGSGCFSDMYFFPEGTIKALFESGMKANIGLTLFGDEKETAYRLEAHLPFLQEASRQSNGSLLFDIAPHAVYTCTTGTYKLAAQSALKEHSRIHTHVAETLKEVTDCLQTYGKTPVEYLASLGVFEADSALAHGIHLTAKERAFIAKRHIPVIHNPSSNCKLACGIAPIADYQKEGIPLALGTDGPASNNALDLFQEIRLAAMLSSVSTANPVALKPFEVLQMATFGGCRALGRADRSGTLQVGKEADLIIIDTKAPHMQPLNDPLSALVYSAKSSDVTTLINGGTILMENRRLTTIDIDSVRQEVQQRWQSIKKRT